MRKPTWRISINDLAIIGFIVATIKTFWGKNMGPKTARPFGGRSAFAHPDRGSLLQQGQQQAGELAATVVTDGESVVGEASVSSHGASWAAKLWAKVTAQRTAKPDVSAGIDVTKRW